jgi:CRISPR-associated exonuclease Cas4
MRLDQIRREGDKLIVSEVKKSSRFLPATRLQLGYYLWRLAEEGMEAAGEILVPEERKRETLELTSELKTEIEQMVAKIEHSSGNPRRHPRRISPSARSAPTRSSAGRDEEACLHLQRRRAGTPPEHAALYDGRGAAFRASGDDGGDPRLR